MRRRDFVRAAAGAALPLSGPLAAADREPLAPREPGGSPPVATLALHYMTWLQRRSWPLASTWPVLRNPAYPLPRGYDSADPVVFRAHNRAAERHGFAWLWSWWGQASVPGGDPTLRRYLDLDPGATVPLVVLYEPTETLAANREGFFDFDDPANARRFADAWLFSTGPTGRTPATPTGSSGSTGAPSSSPGSAATSRARGRRRWRRRGVRRASTWSAHGIYDPRYVPASGRLDAAYASRYEQALRGWAELVGSVAPHARFIPPLQFAFDDRYVRPEARHPPLSSSLEEAIAVARATRRLLDDARVGDARYESVLPAVFLASWNEHLEGSAVEWTDEHGYGYVMAAANVLLG